MSRDINRFEDANHARRSLVLFLGKRRDVRELKRAVSDTTSPIFTINTTVRECLDAAEKEYIENINVAKKAYNRLKEDDIDAFAEHAPQSDNMDL